MMMMLNVAWYEVLFQRHSFRRLQKRDLSDYEYNEMRKFSVTFKPFGEAARIRVLPDGGETVLNGNAGSGEVKGAKAYMAFIGGSQVTPHNLLRAGYSGEAAVLEAVRLGLDTCWVTAHFRSGKVAEQLGLDPGVKVYGVSPLGHGRPESGSVAGHKRLDMESLTVGAQQQELWQASALEAARLAPSDHNRQPWRFVVGADSILLRLDAAPKTRLDAWKYLDCGIAMLHVELGALRAGKPGTWRYILKDCDVARFDVL
jgi:nitroreductase